MKKKLARNAKSSLCDCSRYYVRCATCRMLNYPREVGTNPAVKTQRIPHRAFQAKIKANADNLFDAGREVFRHDSFGSEEFWGDELRLHEAILGEKQGGVGPGLISLIERDTLLFAHCSPRNTDCFAGKQKTCWRVKLVAKTR